MSEKCDPLSFFLFFPFFSLSLGIRSLQAFLCDPWWIMVIPAALANSGSAEHFQVTRKRPRAREGRREVAVAKLWEYMAHVYFIQRTIHLHLHLII